MSTRPKRGTVEYRVRWRRGPIERWKVRLFQEEYAARLFAAFINRPNPSRTTYHEFGRSEVDPIAPATECLIQIRDVTPWRESEIDVSGLTYTRSGRY